MNKKKEEKTEMGFLTLSEAARFLRLSRSGLYQLCARRAVKFFKPSKKLYFRVEDLQKYITGN